MENNTILIIIVCCCIYYCCGYYGYYGYMFLSNNKSNTPNTPNTPNTDSKLCSPVCTSGYIYNKDNNICVNKNVLSNDDARAECVSNRQFNMSVIDNKCEILPNSDGTCMYTIPLEGSTTTYTTNSLELKNNICRPKSKILNKFCNPKTDILDVNGKCNYPPTCMLGTFQDGKCVDIPINGKCSFHTFNQATGKCDLPPKKKTSGMCTADGVDIYIDDNSLPLMLQQGNTNFNLYTFDGDNCIINPIVYTPYCNYYRDDKMDQINPNTNTCQYDGFCPSLYIPDEISEAIKVARGGKQ